MFLSWQEMKFVSHDESNMMHKMIDLQNFSVYLDTHVTMLGSLSMSDLSVSIDTAENMYWN